MNINPMRRICVCKLIVNQSHCVYNSRGVPTCSCPSGGMLWNHRGLKSRRFNYITAISCITCLGMPTLHKTLFTSLLRQPKFSHKNKKNQTKLKISIKWYVVDKYRFDLRDQQRKICMKDPSVFKKPKLCCAVLCVQC